MKNIQQAVTHGKARQRQAAQTPMEETEARACATPRQHIDLVSVWEKELDVFKRSSTKNIEAEMLNELENAIGK